MVTVTAALAFAAPTTASAAAIVAINRKRFILLTLPPRPKPHGYTVRPQLRPQTCGLFRTSSSKKGTQVFQCCKRRVNYLFNKDLSKYDNIEINVKVCRSTDLRCPSSLIKTVEGLLRFCSALKGLVHRQGLLQRRLGLVELAELKVGHPQVVVHRRVGRVLLNA